MRTEAPRDRSVSETEGSGASDRRRHRTPPVMAAGRWRADIAVEGVGQWLEGQRAAIDGRKRVGVGERGGRQPDLVHKNGVVCSFTRWGAHHPKIGFVQTWPRVRRCPWHHPGLLGESTAVGRSDAPARIWAMMWRQNGGWGEGVVMPCQGAQTELALLLGDCGEVRTSVPHLVRGKLGILDLSNFYTGTIFGAPPLNSPTVCMKRTLFSQGERAGIPTPSVLPF